MENFVAQPPVKLLRAPNLKRGKQDERITDRIKLERVLGVTVTSNAALASEPNTETVAYPAGCTVVLFNTTTGQQSHIVNTSRKSVSSLAFSSCGRYLVTGECGHLPAVRIWDLQSDPAPAHSGLSPQIQQVAEFIGHKYGISCVAFSPTNKYVVSIGTQHDMIVNVWDWRSNVKVASNKVSTKVKSVAFAENGSYFVTVGNRHVKFWYLEYGKSKYNKEAVPLMGRSAILGEQRNNYFCDVACGKAQCGDSTYAITRSGLLCEFNNRRLLDKWVELRTASANCISVGEQFIFVGCTDGIVRCFDPSTLRFITTLPRTHYLGVDVSLGLNITHMSSPPKDAKYPDTTAITYDESSNKLTCIYNDHSIYVWDVHNIKRVGKSHSFLYHSACIWGVEMAPPHSPLPAGSFLTCSSDDTIRVWSLDKLTEKSSKGMYRRNIYSNELLKVVYVDKELTYLKDLDVSGSNVSNEKQDTSYDGRNGVRSIRMSPDGKQLASGDRSGNIRVHETTSMAEVLTIEAHDAEVLCLEFSNPSESNGGHRLMASASRDRLIHVFDVNHDYNFLQTLDDHSSSITAVRFLTAPHGNLQMVSCGADKSLIFRSLGGTPNGTPQFQRGHNATGKTTLYDMEIDAGQKHVLTACQDRNVRIYSVGTGKHTKSFKGSTADEGSLIKVVLDKSGIYLATSGTDKTLSVYDYYTGECMATMCGHSELATGLRFTNDCRRLISASGDGCVFVWRVPHDMVVTMHARLSQQAMRQGKTLDQEIFSDSSNVDFEGSGAADANYRFSLGQLPLWAKKHMADEGVPAQPAPPPKSAVAPKGRWAQRAERNVGGVKSFYGDSVIPFAPLHGSDGSKDSSLDGVTEIRQYSSERRELTSISKQTLSTNISLTRGDRRNLPDDRDVDLESNAHDGDIDSDQEYRHQPLYYPTHIDSASGSEFTVTNMDADELRRSVRRSKKSAPPAISIQPASISTGSQESEDDDDEASTPSGENTDRNPLSMLSASSESLDQIVNREKYLQATFESLSGAEMESPTGKSSISSQYHTRTGSTPKLRNMAVINAAKQTKNDSETMKKREELQKRIADTKKKLQSIGYNSPLKYSQSIVDLSHIPEKDGGKWSPGGRKTGNTGHRAAPNDQLNKNESPITNDRTPSPPGHDSELFSDNSQSASVPADLQLCGCYMSQINKNTSDISNLLKPNGAKLTDLLINERKLRLDKTLLKYKMHKSLPVSPVSEECRLSDFAQQEQQRKSFSYFIELGEGGTTDDGFKKICDDIEKFSQDFSRNYQQIEDIFKEKSSPECFINSGKGFVKSHSDLGFLRVEKDATTIQSGYVNEAFMYSGKFECDSLEPFTGLYKPKEKCKKDLVAVKKRSAAKRAEQSQLGADDEDDGNFSSDSLEDCSFNSVRNAKSKKSVPPRRCVSNNELYKLQAEEKEVDYSKYFHECDMPKSESFYLNPSARNSQESILSSEDEYFRKSRSYCNSLESVLSNESDCKSAPLEALFAYGSLPKSRSTQSDFEACYGMYQSEMKRSRSMYYNERPKVQLRTSQTQTDFDCKVVKRTNISAEFQEKLLKFEKPMAFFIKADCNKMDIPTLASKNQQYRSKFCNVLNNKPEANPDYTSKSKNFTLTTHNFDDRSKNKQQNKETASLDRHLLTKSLLDTEKVCHKPPKAVRRHSSKTRKKRTYEYVKKEDLNNENTPPFTKHETKDTNLTQESSIEISYKEKTIENDLETSNNIITQLYKKPTTNQSKNIITQSTPPQKINWNKSACAVQTALTNIKILNDIQRKINTINSLVEVFKRNISVGKVKALSSMYESMEREVRIDDDNDSSLRRACSLSDLSVQGPIVPKRKVDQVSGKIASQPKNPQVARVRSYSKVPAVPPMMRSSSTGVLNQSDSEDGEKKGGASSRLMRPTISSQNKVAASVAKSAVIRKRHSHSVMNLSSVGNEDSSSEEMEMPPTIKPIVPPRTRLHGSDTLRRLGSSVKEKPKPMRVYDNTKKVDLDATLTNFDDPLDMDTDVSTVQLSAQLCDEVALQLTKAADNVVKLYRRLTDPNEEGALEDVSVLQKTDMVKNLELSIATTQKLCQDITLEKFRRSGGPVDVNQTDTVKKLHDLMSRGLSSDQNAFVNVMQMFSDILLGMMQQKMQDGNT